MSTKILQGHSLQLLKGLPSKSIHCVITSSPYWGLRSYNTEPQIWGGNANCSHSTGFDEADGTCRECQAWLGEHGQEPTMKMWLAHEVLLFREVYRVLRDDGVLWINLGDTYATTPNGTAAATARQSGKDDRVFRDKPFSTSTPEIPAKNRLLLPARLAIALQEDGWWVREEVIWFKSNPIPSSVRDRTTPAHETIYMFSKRPTYYYDDVAIEEPCSPKTRPGRSDGRTIHAIDGGNGYDRRVNSLVRTYTSETRRKRSVWPITNEPFAGAHFATFPTALVEPMILASTSAVGVCPTCGSPHTRIRPPRPPADSTRQPTPRSRSDTWRSTCKCASQPPVPATVLDPFGGAGTVGLVANRLKRNAILMELNPTYVEIAQRRLEADLVQPEKRTEFAERYAREGRRGSSCSSWDESRASGDLS